MCGVIFSFFALIIAVAAYFMGAIAIAVIVIVVGLLLSIGNYENARKLKPTPMKCPNCGSENIKIQREITSYSRGSVRTYGSRLSAGSGSTTVNRQRLGVCQDCGYDYPYVSQEEVEQNIEKTKNSYHFWLALTIIAAGIGIWVFLH